MKLKKRHIKKLKKRDVNRLFGSYINEQVTAQVEERLSRQAVSFGSDTDAGDGFRAIGTTRRDLAPIDQDKLINLANYLANANPLAKRIRELKRDFVIGDGVSIEAEDKESIQPIIDEFWADSVNNWSEFQFDIVDYLSINGELYIPTFVNRMNGHTQVGWIDPVEVDKVIADRNNRRIMRLVEMKYGASAGASDIGTVASKRVTYGIANKVTDRKDEKFGYRSGNILQFRINCAPDARRGRSDYESLVDYLDIWDQSVWNDLERVNMLLNFIWDIKLEGFNEKQIEDWVRNNPPPKPGSNRAHNEKCEWKAVSPDLKTQDTRTLSTGVRQDILGSAGFSDFFFGITEGANRASSQNLDRPILQSLQARQRKVRSILSEILDYAIDQKALAKSPAGRKLKLGLETRGISRKFKINMPPLSDRDLTVISTLVAPLAASLDIAVEKQWLSNETAQHAFIVSVLPMLGMEQVKVEDELKRIEAEGDDREAEEEETMKRGNKSLADKLADEDEAA